MRAPLPLRVLLLALLVCFSAYRWAGADWPTYRHDSRRSSLTEETLAWPLHAAWVRSSAAPPAPAWPGPAPADYFHRKFELHSLDDCDTAFHPVIAQGRVFYGSSASDTLYCVDAASGATLWTLVTEGPIRLAPVVAEGRVYVGSDDGRVYCADAASGEPLWTYAASGEDRRLPGNGRMISRWPVRCGLAVEEGTLYFAAGVFPSAGVYLCAVEAASGAEVWKQPVNAPIRGHLVASATRLYATAGRAGCQVYDRANGERVAGFGGGAFAVLVDPASELLVTGPDESGGVTGLDGGVRDKIASVKGLQLVARGEEFFVSTLDAIAAVTAERELLWKHEDLATFSLVLTGDALIAGGDGQVTAYNASDGSLLWQAEVDGQARALAVDDGRLLVGTDRGTLYCFTAEPPEGEIAQTADSPQDARGYADDEHAELYRAAAGLFLEQCSADAGYCLVVDCGQGNLVYELARQSRLQVIGVERDPEKVKIARQRLHAAGLYGRASVHLASGDVLPYQGQTMNLVVCDRLETATDLPSYSAAAVQSLVRPHGGVLSYAASGGTARDLVQGWDASEQLVDWSIEGRVRLPSGETFHWFAEQVGPPTGGGEWTHQYADPGNTACSRDELVTAPLEFQWFGRPGPERMVDRHNRTASPLFVEGRLYIMGADFLIAQDAYNGTILWEREVPDSLRLAVSKDSSNMAAAADAVYVAAGGECLALDPLTGETLHAFEIGEFEDDLARRWGYLAWQDNVLVGSATRREEARTTLTPDSWTLGYLDNSALVFSDELYGFDRQASPGQGEEPLWTYRPETGVVINATIGLAEGRVYFVESTNPAARDAETGRAGLPVLVGEGAKLVALDAGTGQVEWEREIEVERLQHAMFLAVAEGVVLVSGSKNEGSVMRYELSAFDSEGGESLWNVTPAASQGVGGSHGEQDQHPAIVGDVIYTKTFAYSLLTGEPLGAWQIPGGGCGALSTCKAGAFFRSGVPTMTQFKSGESIQLTTSTRPGCWINIIPAGGLVLAPEGSSGCTCGFYGLQTSLAMAPAACMPPEIQPVISSDLPAPGDDRFAGRLQVELVPPSSQVTLHYTLDGTTPTVLSPQYEGPIALEDTATIIARSITPGGLASPVVSRTFTHFDLPRFPVPPGPFVTVAQPVIEQPYGSAVVRYTLDSTAPTGTSPVYAGPPELEVTTTVTAAFFEEDQRLGPDLVGRFEKVAGLLPVDRDDLVPGIDYEYYEAEHFERLPDFDALEPAATGQLSEFTLQVPRRPDNFALRYRGFIEVPADGFYSFRLQSDDGSRLLIGDKEVVNNDGLHDARRSRGGRIALAAGKHPITVEYFDGGLGESLFVYYEGPRIYARPLIPSQALWRPAEEP